MQENTGYYIFKEEITNSETNFGGFWIRLAAYLIDFVVIAIPLVIIESFLSINSYLIPAVWCIYNTCFHSSNWQATIGKRVLGLKVVNIYGERISFARALGRHFALNLSILLLYIGILMIEWTEYMQGLHDLIAKTYVIKSR